MRAGKRRRRSKIILSFETVLTCRKAVKTEAAKAKPLTLAGGALDCPGARHQEESGGAQIKYASTNSMQSSAGYVRERIRG